MSNEISKCGVLCADILDHCLSKNIIEQITADKDKQMFKANQMLKPQKREERISRDI